MSERGSVHDKACDFSRGFFTPLVNENYYIAVRKESEESPEWQAFHRLLQEAGWRAHCSGFAGYDARRCGEEVSVPSEMPWWHGRRQRPPAGP